jgi:DNA circularisation protein
MSRTACAIGKDYAPASFKGVFFYCTEANIEGGRRGAEGEFPFGENTAYADLGRKIRVYNLTAVFREDNHVFDSQALFMACESVGPGILVHPTRGAVMVACRKCKLSDKVEEDAGETHAELEFVEANEVNRGFGGSIFGIISTALFAVSQATFLNDYTPTVVPYPWTGDVIDTAQRMVSVTADTTEQVLPFDAPTSTWRKVLRMQEVATDDGLAASAVNIDNALVDGHTIIANNVPEPRSRFAIYRRLANAALSDKLLPAGPAHESEQAVLTRQRILAAIGMAEAAMGVKYSTTDEGLAAMDAVLVVFADEAKLAYDDCENSLFMELKKYATEFSTMMNEIIYRLPTKIWVNFAGSVHPLVAAYAVYKDAKRHRDIEARNIIDANGRIASPVSVVAPQ